jgi:hypothetical protein
MDKFQIWEHRGWENVFKSDTELHVSTAEVIS